MAKKTIKTRKSTRKVKPSKSAKPSSKTRSTQEQLKILLGAHAAGIHLAQAMKYLSKETSRLSVSKQKKITSIARQELTKAVINDKKPSTSQCNVSFSYLASTSTLPGYCTLDDRHIIDIRAISEGIRVYAKDPSRDRPFNILMLASPGAGKSHFIKCLAKNLNAEGVRSHTYNMTTLERTEDLIHPLDSARNLKVQDHLPLLFLDEFDSKPENYARLLPLLWDGDMHLGHRDLKLGKVVIVLAGSKSELPDVMKSARSMSEESESETSSSKLIDLLSRINGGELKIPSLDEISTNRDRRIDKICIATGLLSSRFGNQLINAPRSLFKFIAFVNFRYGVRSIAHLIDTIPYRKAPTSLTRSNLKLPLDNVAKLKKSSLSYHLKHTDHAHGIVDLWKRCLRNDCAITFGFKM